MIYGTGTGHSKKEAEQKAAEKALKKLVNEEEIIIKEDTPTV